MFRMPDINQVFVIIKITPQLCCLIDVEYFFYFKYYIIITGWCNGQVNYWSGHSGSVSKEIFQTHMVVFVLTLVFHPKCRPAFYMLCSC